VRAIVLQGAPDFFSNGIDLNTIEASAIPQEEGWRNINAIDDLVEAILMSKMVVISAVEGNAGAGGVALAIAADHVIASEGSVLNMHYQNMGLFGSEFWTYSLKKRVGERLANILTENCEPMIGT
jgi:putative two-component system protein, hydrogenase maturation factor HypX/HoxX